MASFRLRRGLGALACFAAGSIGGPAALAAKSDPFAYKLVLTPEEGPRNRAVEARYSADFAHCQDAAQSTPENAECFQAEFARQDAALNRAWLRLSMRPEALRVAQRRWVTQRDPFCSRHSDSYRPGTIAPVIYVSCRVELTIRRTIWLEGLRL